MESSVDCNIWLKIKFSKILREQSGSIFMKDVIEI